MATVSARLTLIGDSSYSEPDQDANSALTELDKGLHSHKIGEQCEAIVRFPRLYEKYPFPILINSACLKLAEVFRYGSNFLRVLVFQVMQQSQKHLDKILNIDEFVRRIFVVIYSNDPIARALTLKTLGSIATIVSEHKNIHHSIRISLDSKDSVELEAAIFATGCFAAHSKTFASNICPKLGEMIQGLSTPTSVKLKLLAVFQQMHHDATTTSMVKKVCCDLLPSYPSIKFVQAALHTLTLLTVNSLIEVQPQIGLLLEYLHVDPRAAIKRHALQDLKILACKGSHLWTSENIQSLVTYSLNTPYISISHGCISVLAVLAQNLALDKFDLSPGSKVSQLLQDFAFHSNTEIAAATLTLITPLANHNFQETKSTELMQEAASAIEHLLLNICMSYTPNQELPLKQALKCIVSLCEANPELCLQFVDVLGSLLLITPHESCVPPLCESLGAIGSSKRPGNLSFLQPNLSTKLAQVANAATGQDDLLGPEHTLTVVKVCTLLFQAGFSEREAIFPALQHVDQWTAFKVARQAARYGHHHLASDIFRSLAKKVSSEHLHFWLQGLQNLSEAEESVATSDLDAAITHYSKSLSALRAGTSLYHSLQFQCEYVRLRGEALQTHLLLHHILACVQTSPPPAIAASVAMAHRDELHKSGRIVLQLRKCSKEFYSLAEQYNVLYQSIFDADPKTLANILILQHSCVLTGRAIDRIAQHSQGLTAWDSGIEGGPNLSIPESAHHALELSKLVDACQRASSLVSSQTTNTDMPRVIGKKEADHLMRVSKILVLVPLPLPRFFFQTLQSTSIKLAISPQPKGGEAVFTPSHAHLAVKVEGVVQHGPKGKVPVHRRVAKVLLQVSSTLQTPARDIYNKPIAGTESNSMSQTVTPHNDYFQAQFLLLFPAPGVHAVTVEASVCDEYDVVWCTGPRAPPLLVKSHEEHKPPPRPPQPSTSTPSTFVPPLPSQRSF